MLADPTRRVTGGVDTHKHTNVAAVIDHLGAAIDTRTFPTTSAGYGQLLGWLESFGTLERVGIEGTGSYGAGLTRHLNTAGVQVVEVNRPNRQSRRRVGKSDPLDAISAARAALGGLHAGTPKCGDGPVEATRLLRHDHRRVAVAARRTGWAVEPEDRARWRAPLRDDRVPPR